MNPESLRSLQKRIREATGPDRELDALIACEFFDGTPYRQVMAWGRIEWLRQIKGNVELVQPYTLDPDGLGPCVALQRIVLPGWCWKVGTCCVSDDAWTAPDWNSPEHGERLRKQYGEPVFGTVFDQGVDIDRRPPGNVCLAFLDAIVSAKIAELEAKEKADV